jgi:hypothetical protein
MPKAALVGECKGEGSFFSLLLNKNDDVKLNPVGNL